MTDIVEREVKSNRAWREECESLRQQLAESDKSTLRLLETIKYLAGIAERGEGRKQLDGETVERFVLGYVKRIEQQLAECQAKVQKYRGDIASYIAMEQGEDAAANYLAKELE
jgi:hypothetical protein